MTRHGTRAQSGAAASTTATVEALAGLFSVIRITLSDDSTADARSSAASAQTGASLQPLKCTVSDQQLVFLFDTNGAVCRRWERAKQLRSLDSLAGIAAIGCGLA